MLRAAARLIVPDPACQERQVELLGAAGAKVVTFAPVVPHRTPHCARKIDIARQVEPDDGLRSRQSQVEMARVVAVHDPSIVGNSFRQPLTKARRLALDPAWVPVERIEVHDRKAETRADPACQRGLAGAARPEDENALRRGHLTPFVALTRILVCFGFLLASCHSTIAWSAIACASACECGSKTQRLHGNTGASAARRSSREAFMHRSITLALAIVATAMVAAKPAA